MRMYGLLLALLAGCSGCVSVPAYAPVYRVAMKIEMGGGSCSATAVSQHWLLTAGHCLAEGGPVTKANGQPVKMLDVILDGYDHALVRVDTTFPAWAQVGARPLIGERLRILGNPMDLVGVYRTGSLAAVNHMASCPNAPGMYHKDCTVLIFEMVTGPGDSGSGYYDDAGEVVAVHTGTTPVGLNGMAFAFPLAFSAKQWAVIR